MQCVGYIIMISVVSTPWLYLENEFHLIVECEYYATLRNTYLKSEYLNYIRFIELFTSTDKSILFNLATFLYKSLLLRSNV